MLVMKLFKVNIGLTIQENGFDIDKKSQFKTGFFILERKLKWLK